MASNDPGRLERVINLGAVVRATVSALLLMASFVVVPAANAGYATRPLVLDPGRPRAGRPFEVIVPNGPCVSLYPETVSIGVIAANRTVTVRLRGEVGFSCNAGLGELRFSMPTLPAGDHRLEVYFFSLHAPEGDIRYSTLDFVVAGRSVAPDATAIPTLGVPALFVLVLALGGLGAWFSPQFRAR